MSDPLQHLRDKYEIVAEIQQGGMGKIYKVRHRELDVIRVVKVLRTEHPSNPELQARFRNEARATARIQHPNIVPIHDFILDDEGHGVIVMEHIEGVDLRNVIDRQRPLSLSLALEIALQCLAGLAHLHEHGIVHRDVSPDNFMLTRDLEGEPLVKLIDLGLAKHSDRVGATTEVGTFLGKVRYASPEHFGSGHVEARSDIYSFGIVLYELLTGRFPISGESATQLMASHLDASPLDFETADPKGRIPQTLRDVALKALAKRREERYASAGEFAEEIRALQGQLRLPSGEFGELSRVLKEATVRRSTTIVDSALKTATLGGWELSARDGRRERSTSPFIVGQPIERDEDFFGFQAQRERLRDFLESGQSVQVFGGQRMGKTSLLKWVARHAPQWQDRPVVWINAQGLAGQSPEDLVLAVAGELERRSDSEQALASFGGGPGAAARVLDDLLPLVLLVDEASVLAQPQHGFDVGFLGALRTFCQDRRLVWVSASLQDIRRLFRDTGLASRFLNDARVLWVGQLEEDDARDLVGRLGEEHAEVALREAGGFAFGLQWLADALWRDSSDPESVCDVFAEEMKLLVFDGWWASLAGDDREILKGCVRGGTPRAELTDRPRRRAQGLKRQGLLAEVSGRFVVPGAAWRNFVWDSR